MSHPLNAPVVEYRYDVQVGDGYSEMQDWDIGVLSSAYPIKPNLQEIEDVIRYCHPNIDYTYQLRTFYCPLWSKPITWTNIQWLEQEGLLFYTNNGIEHTIELRGE